VGTTIHTSVDLLVGLALWQVLLATGMAVANFLNGTNEIWFQVKIGVVSAAFAILLKIFLVLKIGISGVVWATIFAFTVFSVVPLYFFLSKKLSSVGEIKGETVRNETA
jgi:O-antigen/teichoic acid export membrane protein